MVMTMMMLVYLQLQHSFVDAIPQVSSFSYAAKEIVYATREMGGLGFKDIHVTQLIEHVKILLDHGLTDTVSGKLLKIVAEATIIE